MADEFSEFLAILEAKKKNLVKVMSENEYSTKNPLVRAAVDDLNKAWLGAGGGSAISSADSELRYGDWRILSAPEFPNRIENDENECRYTLGRLSFNLFQPQDIICTLNHVDNKVKKIDEETDTYNLLQDLTIHGGADGKTKLPAKLQVEATYSSKTDHRATIVFRAGELFKGEEVDRDPTLQNAWNETFEGAYEKSKQETGILSRMVMGLFSYVVDLKMPTDERARFEMKRPKSGWIDYLYLDETMRVTKGNRGTIVVVVKESRR